MAADVGIFFDAACTDEVSNFPSYVYPIWRSTTFIGNLGSSEDVHLYVKNTGDVALEDVTVTSTDSEGSDESGWNAVATTQAGLDTGGTTVNLGDIGIGADTALWLRTTVPSGTSIGTKYDVYLNVTAV